MVGRLSRLSVIVSPIALPWESIGVAVIGPVSFKLTAIECALMPKSWFQILLTFIESYGPSPPVKDDAPRTPSVCNNFAVVGFAAAQWL